MIPIAYNVRNLRVRKTTTFAAVFGLALVVFVFASVNMLTNGLKKTLGRSASPDVAMLMRKGADAELSSGIDEPNVKLAIDEAGPGAIGSPELVVVVLLDKFGTEGQSNVQIRGVTPDAYKLRPKARIIEGREAKPGADEVVVGKAIRGRFKGLEIGQKFDLKKNRPVAVVGVLEDEGSSFESEVWVDLHAARTAFGRETVVSSIRVKLASPAAFDAYKASIEQNRQLGIQVMREADYYEKQSEVTAIFITAMGVMIAIFFSLGAMIGATITMHAQVAHREREIGTLRALGFSRTSILFSFLLEALMLALVGGVVGSIAALCMGTVQISTMNFATWSEICLRFEPTPAILIKAVALAAVMGTIGGFFPALRAARVSPVEAMRA